MNTQLIHVEISPNHPQVISAKYYAIRENGFKERLKRVSAQDVSRKDIKERNGPIHHSGEVKRAADRVHVDQMNVVSNPPPFAGTKVGGARDIIHSTSNAATSGPEEGQPDEGSTSDNYEASPTDSKPEVAAVELSWVNCVGGFLNGLLSGKKIAKRKFPVVVRIYDAITDEDLDDNGTLLPGHKYRFVQTNLSWAHYVKGCLGGPEAVMRQIFKAFLSEYQLDEKQIDKIVFFQNWRGGMFATFLGHRRPDLPRPPYNVSM